MGKLERLKAELTAGHPVTGAYNDDDSLAHAELNAKNIADDADSKQLLQYFILERQTAA